METAFAIRSSNLPRNGSQKHNTIITIVNHALILLLLLLLLLLLYYWYHYCIQGCAKMTVFPHPTHTYQQVCCISYCAWNRCNSSRCIMFPKYIPCANSEWFPPPSLKYSVKTLKNSELIISYTKDRAQINRDRLKLSSSASDTVKVITTKAIRPLDDRNIVLDLRSLIWGLWGKLYDC